MPEPLYLDSNVFLYAFVGDPVYGAACARVLADVDSGAVRGATSCLALLELANALRRMGLQARAGRAVAGVRSLPLEVADVTADLAEDAAAVAARTRKNPYDALHAATMARIGLTRIVSADADFDRIPSLARIDPRAYPP